MAVCQAAGVEDTQLTAAVVIRVIHRDEDGEGDKGSSATPGRAQTLPPTLAERSGNRGRLS